MSADLALTRANAAQAQARIARPFNAFSPYAFGGVGDGVADDSAALIAAVAAAVAARGGVYLGSGKWRTTRPIGTKIGVPITVIGDGPGNCSLVIDPAMPGDLLSFSNVWYGVEQVIQADGTTATGNPVTGMAWPALGNRKSGVRLEGFSVIGDRRAPTTQNGIVFYDRNDAVIMRRVRIEFVRGIGLCLSGLASNVAANAATLLRESYIKDCEVRWCGDWASGSPSVMMACSSKTIAQSGRTGTDTSNIFDDANNYNCVEGLKIIFAEGIGLQCNGMNWNSAASHSNNRVQVIVDSQRGPPASPDVIPGGYLPSGYASISNGVLKIDAGGAFVRNTGSGQGTLSVGTYVFNANVPPGTYISAIVSGPATDGAGTYQLANRQVDISGLTVAAGPGAGQMGSCRFTTPMLEIGGGHAGEEWDVITAGSNTAGSNGTAIVYNQNPLTSNTPKTQACRARLSLGSGDLGILFSTISSLAIKMTLCAATVPVTISAISQAVTIDMGKVTSGKSGEIQINGGSLNLHVYPGGQKVVYGSAITDLMTAGRWPNCEIYLNNAGALTRYVSVQTSAATNTWAWTAV